MALRLFKPKRYQIRWLEADAVHALLAAGISLDSSDDGIFIQAQDLPKVLTTLNKRVVATYPSQFKRIDEAVLLPNYERRDQGTVNIDYGTGEKSPETESIVSVVAGELLPILRRDIVVHLAAGAVCAPIVDGRFHIFVDAAAAASEHTEIPEQVFGVPVQFKQGFFSRQLPVAYRPSGRGGSIVDWSTEFTAAEIVDDCLYIHFDLLRCKPTHTQLVLLARILRKTADQLLADQLLAEVVRTVAAERENGAAAVPIRFDRVPRHFARQTLSLIGSVLSLQVTRPIVVHMAGGVQKPVDDGQFHVFLPGSPVKTIGAEIPLQLFGVAVTCKNKAWSLASGCTPITDDCGFMVAQLVGMNNLFIAFNPVNDTADGIGNIRLGWELLGRILRAALKELDVDSIIREIISEESGVTTATNWSIDQALPRNVEVSGFGGRALAVVKSLSAQLLAPALDRDVYVYDSRGENQMPVRDGRFYVFFQGTPIGEACASTPSELFGVALPTRERAFWPSGKGIAIADGAGFLVGELVDNNLYIHAKLIHHGTRSEARMLARLMAAALREYALAARADKPEDTTGNYESICWSRVKARLDNSVHSPVNSGAVALAEGTLRESIQLTQRCERELLRLEVSEQFGREYDELLAIQKVRNVTVGNGQIVVDTNTLFCVDTRTGINHEIGAFKIHIPTESGRLKWFNQTRTVGPADARMNAPHVAATGLACEGSTKDEWPHFIAQRQFAYVVMKAIQFIESANTDDAWGKKISDWPVAAQS